MPTSELSDALNPSAVRPRTMARTRVAELSSPSAQHFVHQFTNQSHARYTPHRSELELAMIEPQSPPRSEVQRLSQQGNVPPILQEIIRMVTAQEAERERRLAWEQEQEAKVAKAAAKQTEADKEMHDMREEIASLRAFIHSHHSEQSASSSTCSVTDIPLSSTPNSPDQHSSPISPLSQSGSPFQRPFAYYSYSASPPSAHTDRKPYIDEPQPIAQASTYHAAPATLASMQPCDRGAYDPPSYSITPGRSSQSSSIKSPDSTPPPIPASTPVPFRGKQKRNIPTSSENDSDSSIISSSAYNSSRPRKRVNHHDKRCLTIQHALRAHFWLMLATPSDSKLPPSYIEGSGPLGPSDPVRFVWEKTTKQSVHNTRMKTRVLQDIKQNRQQYRHVPSKDFSKKILDATFEQCFTTFRQKYRAQTDENIAAQNKKREETKAKKARHTSRRKMKLSNRAEARAKLQPFEHVIFDSALRIECMSSEESDFEDTSSGVLRTRGYAWRSSRLLRLYYALDQEEISDKSLKPRRGVGKKERLVGPPKEEPLLPPNEVAPWMISRRWLKTAIASHPELPEVLGRLITREGANFSWTDFHVLGEETEVSDEEINKNVLFDFDSPSMFAIPHSDNPFS